MRRKVRGLSRKLGGTGFGNWIKAGAIALLKVFKLIGSWAVSQVTRILMGSLQSGMSKMVDRLLRRATPEGAKSIIEEFYDLKAKYEKLIWGKTAELEQKIFGDKIKLLSKLSKIMDVVKTIGRVISLIKWGIRIVACLSPPGIGCLWNLAISALQ